jgi:hypothetical protein
MTASRSAFTFFFPMSGILNPLRSLVALLMVAVAGAFLLPWQMELQRLSKKARFRTTALDLSIREQIGQSGFIAALSGFRSPVAAFLWIDAHMAWERTEWGRMEALFNTVTTLQPHSLLYWDIAAWHMAWNASAAAQQDRKQQSEVLRERARRQYIELGRDFLERGIRNNPDSYLLQERLGILLRDKVEDHDGAANAFARAASLPGAPAYIARFAGYEAAKVPGRERDAYDRLLALYNEGGRMRAPNLTHLLRQLEEKLNIPVGQRIKAPAPSGVPSHPSR